MTIELNNNVYTDGGNDTETTPVVLVHGFPVDHRMWDECAVALRDQAVKQGVKPFAICVDSQQTRNSGFWPNDIEINDVDGVIAWHLRCSRGNLNNLVGNLPAYRAGLNCLDIYA